MMLISILVLLLTLFLGIILLNEQGYSNTRKLRLLDKQIKDSKDIDEVQKELSLLKSRVDGLCFKAGFTK